MLDSWLEMWLRWGLAPTRSLGNYVELEVANARPFANSERFWEVNGRSFAAPDHHGLPKWRRFGDPGRVISTTAYEFVSLDHPRLPNRRPFAALDHTKQAKRCRFACLDRSQLMAGNDLRQKWSFQGEFRKLT